MTLWGREEKVVMGQGREEGYEPGNVVFFFFFFLELLFSNIYFIMLPLRCPGTK